VPGACATEHQVGVPTAVLKALAHKCALLSSVNPDSLTERFGHWAKKDDFTEGLKLLFEDVGRDIWARRVISTLGRTTKSKGLHAVR